MQHRVSLLMRVAAQPGAEGGTLGLTHPETQRDLTIPQLSVLLTLTHDPGTTFCRGQVTLMPDNTIYPIQSNVAFFQALAAFLAQPEASG
jgi:hypothetical protein